MSKDDILLNLTPEELTILQILLEREIKRLAELHPIDKVTAESKQSAIESDSLLYGKICRARFDKGIYIHEEDLDMFSLALCVANNKCVDDLRCSVSLPVREHNKRIVSEIHKLVEKYFS